MESEASLPEKASLAEMFRPPVDRAMRALDRTFFRKTLDISAARIFENKNISRIRTELMRNKDALDHPRLVSVRPDPDVQLAKTGSKCLLLRPEIKHNDSSTWSSKVQELVQESNIGLIPYSLTLDYEFWNYQEIMQALLPETEQDELPTGFSIAGHVAHLNLRDQFLPYKHIIAAVLLDKNPSIKTVINKIENVGTHSEFRTFDYEVLAGEDNLKVEAKEEECVFRFDYSKVYWNSRLNHEHRRLVQLFNKGEVVCDVMAGVGPFAVPAGKKGVFVWANDLNPASYESLQEAITRNKVSKFVQAFNMDGREFIRRSATDLLSTRPKVVHLRLKKPLNQAPGTESPPPEKLSQPSTFNHYVMNLPASATSFLDAFVSLYKGHEGHFSPFTDTRLPMIHVHCFSTKSDDMVAEKIKICEEISQRIGYKITPDTPEVEIYDVRGVAPQKRMYCASFRLPPEVAFR